MVKLRKEKFLVSLVLIVLITFVFASISSLVSATEGQQLVADTNTTSTNEESGAVNNATTTENTNSNTNGTLIPATVGSPSANNTVNNTNTNTSSNTNATNSNTNKVSSSLPYAGSGSSMVFVTIALVASALYAYKKVSDYNV